MRLDYIENDQYLHSEYALKFTSFLHQIIHGKRNIYCQYVPKKDKRNMFSITSFEEGVKQYIWAGKSFSETKSVIEKLSYNLSLAIKENDELMMLQGALSILEWGQVYRGCIDWLLQHSKNDQLISSIINSSNIISGSTYISESEFIKLFDRDGTYRCNSGTTKIFAMCSSKSIIYDGRVACAIGMLVHDFLIENDIDYLPHELNFLMDATQRDTSKYTPPSYLFASKKDVTNSLYNQAVSNLKINLILQHIVNQLPSDLFGSSSPKEQFRAIEASMFMIGYQVNVERYEMTGRFLI